MSNPNDLASEIPTDDAALDLILRTGIHAGRWPFATLPGDLPASTLLRVAERTRILQEAGGAVADAMQRNRESFQAVLLDALGRGLDIPVTA